MLKETPVKDIARGRWQEILSKHGFTTQQLSGRHCPCPLCGGKDRFRFDDRNGNGTYFCSHCGAGDGFMLLGKVKNMKFADIAQQIRSLLGHLPTVKFQAGDPQRDLIRQQRAIRNAWEGAWQPSPGSAVGRYLSARLGRPWASKSIRECSSGMIAILRDAEGKPVNCHITYLTREGDKRSGDMPNKRFMTGPIPEGSAVRIWDEAPIMGIAEGIETAMAAAIMFKMPVWAACNATLLSKWVPPVASEEIHIFADNDENFTGQAKAYELAHKLKLRFNKNVVVHIPKVINEDWNDELKKQIGDNNGASELNHKASD